MLTFHAKITQVPNTAEPSDQECASQHLGDVGTEGTCQSQCVARTEEPAVSKCFGILEVKASSVLHAKVSGMKKCRDGKRGSRRAG